MNNTGKFKVLVGPRGKGEHGRNVRLPASVLIKPLYGLKFEVLIVLTFELPLLINIDHL